MNNQKVILSAAITGVVTSRFECPNIPYTPSEMADEAKRAVDAGASIIHIHAREDDGTPSMRLEIYEQIDAAVREKCPEAIINYTTGAIGMSDEDRLRHVAALKPDIACLNMGSMNYAIYSANDKQFFWNDVFANSFDTIQYSVKTMTQVGTAPEMECFDIGHLHNTIPLIEMGLIPDNAYYSLVLGVLGGMQASPENLMHFIKQLPEDAVWQAVCWGRQQWQLSAIACTMGGHFRVGFEDNHFLPSGEIAKSNGELVECGVKLANMMGREVASISETREIMKLSQ